MRWLRRDEGATIVIVALAMVALIGMVGLVIDVARIYEERRELSRGADAAVLAIAADCGTKAAPCDDATAMATSSAYADANADDGMSGIDALDLDLENSTVHVRTNTIDANDGTDQLKMLFLRLCGFNGTTVKADATAEWGYPTGAGTVPIIISDCEYFKFVDPVTGPDESNIVTITFHDGRTTEDCNAEAGQDTDGDGVLSGGFGWLFTSGDCVAEVHDGNWVDEDPGASPSTGCDPQTLYDLIFDKTIIVSYFDDTVGLGANGMYQIAGVGAFHVTGYNFGGQYKEPSAVDAPCDGDIRCMSGYFTTAVTDSGELGGENRGVVVVRLIG